MQLRRARSGSRLQQGTWFLAMWALSGLSFQCSDLCESVGKSAVAGKGEMGGANVWGRYRFMMRRGLLSRI